MLNAALSEGALGAIAVGSLIAGPLADQLGPGMVIVVVGLCCRAASAAVTTRVS